MTVVNTGNFVFGKSTIAGVWKGPKAVKISEGKVFKETIALWRNKKVLINNLSIIYFGQVRLICQKVIIAFPHHQV